MPGEKSADMTDVGNHVKQELLAFRERDGRSIHLEIEPGTFLVANGGSVIATCVDVVDTGRDGYLFAKLDTGMTRLGLMPSDLPDATAHGVRRKAKMCQNSNRQPRQRARRPRLQIEGRTERR